MASNKPQFCHECGAPLQPGQKFCTRCGTTFEEDAYKPTVMASNTPPPPPPNDQFIDRTMAADATPPPPPPPFATYPNSAPNLPPYQPQVSNPSLPPYSQQVSSPSLPDAQNRGPNFAAAGPVSSPSYPNAQVPPAANQAVPAYAQKPKKNRSCLIISIVLLVILALGVGGCVLTWNFVSHWAQGLASTDNTPTTGTNDEVTPTSGPQINLNAQVNLAFVYSNIKLTIPSVQESNHYSDDSGSDQPLLVRVNLQEENATSQNPDYLYSQVLLLVLPNGNTVQASRMQQDVSPDAGVKRTNWADFPLSTQTPLDQLTLRVGTHDQNQLDIPLKAGADLSKYQDKTSKPNSAFQYAQLNWTLQTATLSYSYNDTPAASGKRFVILTLAIVNNTSNNYYNSPNDFLRIQVSGSSLPPESGAKFTVPINANSSGSGTVAFAVPQDATSFTLVLLADNNATPPAPQVTQNFTVQ